MDKDELLNKFNELIDNTLSSFRDDTRNTDAAFRFTSTNNQTKTNYYNSVIDRLLYIRRILNFLLVKDLEYDECSSFYNRLKSLVDASLKPTNQYESNKDSFLKFKAQLDAIYNDMIVLFIKPENLDLYTKEVEGTFRRSKQFEVEIAKYASNCRKMHNKISAFKIGYDINKEANWRRISYWIFFLLSCAVAGIFTYIFITLVKGLEIKNTIHNKEIVEAIIRFGVLLISMFALRFLLGETKAQRVEFLRLKDLSLKFKAIPSYLSQVKDPKDESQILKEWASLLFKPISEKRNN